MDERSVVLGMKCEEVADWLEARDLCEVTKEDREFLAFLAVRWSQEHAGLLLLVETVFLVGYKKGYEVASLEAFWGK